MNQTPPRNALAATRCAALPVLRTQIALIYIVPAVLLVGVLWGSSPSAWANDSADDPASDTEIRMGGYIQPGFIVAANSEYNQDDQEGFEFSNARLTGAAHRVMGGKLESWFHFNFDVNQGNFSVKDVYATVAYAGDLIALDVGKMKMPFGLAQLQSEAYLQMALSPRSRQLTFGRDLGAQLRGAYFVGRTHIKWRAMVANGEGGFRQRRNLDNHYVWAGRLEVVPLGELGKSEADLERGELRLALGGNVSWTASLNNALGLADVGAKEQRYGLDLRLKWRGVSMRVEGIIAKRGKNGTSDGFWRSGGYVQAGYLLPWVPGTIEWEPVVRVEEVDINRDSDGLRGGDYIVDETAARTYEAGVNSYLAGHSAKLNITYRRTDFQEGPVEDRDGGPLVDDSLLFFLQVGWL